MNMITDASDVCMACAQARKKRQEEVEKIRLEEQQRKQQVIQQSLLYHRYFADAIYLFPFDALENNISRGFIRISSVNGRYNIAYA